MSIQRTDLDLTVARDDFQINLGAAAWIRFFTVGAACSFKLNTPFEYPFPIDSPYTLNLCSKPATLLFFTNAAAASGTCVIVWSDGAENVDDFLAGESAAGALATTQQFLLTEAVLSHSFWHPNTSAPQEAIATSGTAATAVVSAGGTAGQNFGTALPYYGGLTASVLASAVALNGGSIVWNTRPLNMDIVLTALCSTAPTYTPSPEALAQSGLWYLRTDWLLETPTVGVPALDMVASVGLGFEPASTTSANGLGGCRGCAIVWSNDRGNDNFWLVAADGTNVTNALDLGVSALGHHVVEFQWGVRGGVAQVIALIDGVEVGSLTTLGMTLLTLSGFGNSVWFPRITAMKIQAAQAGNNVSLRHGGYMGYAIGRTG